ncbi:MAG: hypothetical protein J6S63_09500 [Atopobiaceae bacterium]|nr:hypothetical protein [Atopobiaceae bacterium]
MGPSYDRGGDPSRAGDAISMLLGGPLGRGLSAASKAARAWYAANGDRERAHTTGVWLQKSGRAGIDPVLVVALDSHLLASELGTNKDLYLSRLAFRGVAVSDVRFTVRPPQAGAQRGKRGHGPNRMGAQESCAATLPELTPAELERVERATRGLPQGLRQSVSRAMCASLRRSKGRNTQTA